MTTPALAVILSACRTPIGSFGGALKEVTASDLGAIVVREAIQRASIGHDTVDDVVLGCVLQAGAGMNVARQAALKAGLPSRVPAETINRVCGSGLQAVIHAVEATGLGSADTVVAGGTESMSNAPYVIRGARWGYRLGHGELSDTLLSEGLACAIEQCHMGVTAEEIAVRYSVTRKEQDVFAAESQRRAASAISAGLFTEEIVALQIPQKGGPAKQFDTDEHPRHGTTSEQLGKLRAAFKQDRTVTAGNASGINDGAAAVVVTSAARAQQLGRVPLARVLSYAVAGVDPLTMGIGPVPAVRTALKRAQLGVSDVDLYELNEAFASQSLAVTRELGLDQGRINVRGGAIALGHPIGASGARILTTLIFALKARGGGKGVAALCIGGGMGIAIVIDVPE